MQHDAGVRDLPTIGVLILNRNGSAWLPTIYGSLRGQDYPNVRTYLVDNGSEDNSVDMTRESYPEVTVLRLPRNLGYCMAYNVTMPYAFADGCDWVIWANNDVLLEPGCLLALAETALSDSTIGVIGPAFFAWDCDEPNYYIVGNYPYVIPAMQNRSLVPVDVDWVEGSFLMVHRQCVQQTGPLDPYLFFYWEETDFCRRARHQGWRVVVAPKALARHYAGGWSKADQQNRQTANKLQSRNFYIYKFADPFTGFTRNTIQALHAFAYNIRTYLFRTPSVAAFHGRVFAGVLRDIATVYRKWHRDSRREHPPLLTGNVGEVEVEVIAGRKQSYVAPAKKSQGMAAC